MTQPIEDYVRKATVVRVVDGDTIVVNVDLGFGIWRNNQKVRLLGIDCPEVVGKTKAAGLAAKDATIAWLAGLDRVLIQTFVVDTDSFGRTLAKVWRPGSADDLSGYLLAQGHAVASK